MRTAVVSARQTKYVTAVYDALHDLRHATNLELHSAVRKLYPEVSFTTIHRVSARLNERGIIERAPKTSNGSERYDSNPAPHHHFLCLSCSRICDIPETPEAQSVINQLKKMSGECALAGTLTMQGICKKCVKGNA